MFTPWQWDKRLEPLMQTPREWQKVFESENARTAHSTRYKLAKGDYKTPEGKWEFSARTEGETTNVYARYLGEA